MLWRGVMGFTKFGDKRVNLDLLSGYVVGVACLHRENPCRRICMQLAFFSVLQMALARSFLFFPSDASWLSPGRSTGSIACCSDE